MKIVDLIQGSPEWHAHRRKYWNASDAPAMMGVSPHKTRDQLLRELATGITPDIDAATQARFEDGHRCEALARPLAEKILGEDLYPCVGVDGRYSASFDGLTLLEDTAFEHKSVNDDLRALLRIEEGEQITGADLREDYRVQMEQQCLVSGAARVLFMATRWEGETLVEQFWCWYKPDPELRARIVAGWPQFERDRQDWQPVEHRPQPVAAPVEGFGVLALRVEGRVLASNLDAFRAGADAFLARLPKPADLQTDQDFADADAAAKACADAEDRIKSAKELALEQMSDVAAVLRTADTIAETIRRARLALEKAVAAEKESRKAALVRAGVESVHAHYAEINATLGEHSISVGAEVPAAIGASIKGFKTLAGMRDRINTAVASAKIYASRRAERIRACIAVLAEHAEHAHLFPDRVRLCAEKMPDDLRNLAASRIAEHAHREEERERQRQQQEAERVAREEQRVREAEEAKAARAMPTASMRDFQNGVDAWMLVCFGAAIASDTLERADRLIEEALEAAQTVPAFTAERAHALVDYVFGRPVGDVRQEVGGVMVTLAAFCSAADVSMAEAATAELARVHGKIAEIRAKQAAKPKGSALPMACKRVMKESAL